MNGNHSTVIKALGGEWDQLLITKLSSASVSSKPLLLVGDAQDVDLATFAPAQSPRRVAHLVHLRQGDSGTPRAVCSGDLNPDEQKSLRGAGVYYVGAEIGNASAISRLEEALCAVHTVLAAEAFALGLASGLNPRLLYQAIANAAGGSWSFRHMVPQMYALNGAAPKSTGQTLAEAKSALTAALSLAAQQTFYAPLTSLAFQLLQLAPEAEADGSSARVFDVYHRPQTANGHAESHVNQSPTTPQRPGKIGCIGLGNMGYGMANVLRRAGLPVVGYDVWEPSRKRYEADGGLVTSTVVDCATDSDVLLLMVLNGAQAESVLIADGAAKALPQDAVILLMSTLSPSAVMALESRLHEIRPDVTLVDAPVSGGTIRAAIGDLTILCSGLDRAPDVAGAKALCVLQALSQATGELGELILVPGGAGKGAAVKCINQHLAGSHVSSTMEYLAFASRLKLPLRTTREVFLSGPAASWMMGHRGKNMLDGLIQPPTSALTTFVKDMGIVASEAATLGCPVPLAALVQQQFILGVANGWGKDDDASMVRLWDSCGISVVCPP